MFLISKETAFDKFDHDIPVHKNIPDGVQKYPQIEYSDLQGYDIIYLFSSPMAYMFFT